ncbi:S1C family serine protease [Halorussus salinisoli]|uniref:S1C family serine protease n=1 Tax=Halorussus salinisoli TaxID=2558242 RepID=UPI002A91421B|nr:trypsin-like peptidase domain-containing protein [Halorussus salinisoli]
MRGQTRLLVGVLALALLGMGPVGAVGAGPTGTVENRGTNDTAMQVTCDYQSLYNETIGSVVTVQVLTQNGQGLGSGFVYDGEGRIVTNQHVVGNASTVEVQFDRGEWRTAEVVGRDAYSDLAVLDVENSPNYADPLDLEPAVPDPGKPVAAFGSPLGLPGTITNGIVSGTNRSIPAGGAQGPQFRIPNTVQTTAAINPGNSGGPLVDCDGQVVGVNTAALSGSENTGFAVPARRVERVVPALIENGSYAHSFLGITSADVTPIVAEANDLNVTRGLLVRRVVPGSPADGVLEGGGGTERVRGVEVPVGGDVIVAIDGREVDSGEDLSSYLTEARPGDTVTLTILRDGERMQVEIELGERPPPGEEL